MVAIAPDLSQAFAQLLAARRSTRRLRSGPLPQGLCDALVAASRMVPSAFDSQPWQVVMLHERNTAFWDTVEEAIAARLVGERRERYLRRAANFREGVLTLLVFEDLSRSGPRDALSEAEAGDQTSQSLGMLQLALWLTLSSSGLAASLQHWHAFLEDAALAFCGLPPEGYRLVALMPVGYEAESPSERAAGPSRVAFERFVS